jgi:hypothetical protein
MLRCAFVSRLVMAATVSLLGLPALAQAPRNFPATALRGEIVIVQPPDIAVNGRSARLAPGSRIRNTQNLLTLSGALVGQPLTVHYTVDPLGLVLDVWILTDAERARQPWPTTPAQAAAWLFDPVEQTWSPR